MRHTHTVTIEVGDKSACGTIALEATDCESAYRELLAMPAEIDRLRAALDQCGTAGNHLGLVIAPDHLPSDTPYDVALEKMGAGPAYETWVAWSIIHRAYRGVAGAQP